MANAMPERTSSPRFRMDSGNVVCSRSMTSSTDADASSSPSSLSFSPAPTQQRRDDSGSRRHQSMQCSTYAPAE
jgi:hypothetical protein